MSNDSLPGKALHILYLVFRKDIGRKLLALFLALVVWVYVSQKVVTSETHYLGIRIVQGRDAFLEESAKVDESFFIILPENLMERGTDKKTFVEDQELRVILSGPRDRLPSRLVGKFEIVAQSLLGDRESKTVTIELLKEYFKDLRETPGVRASFDPPTIDLNLAVRKEHSLRLTGAENLIIKNKLPPELELSYDPAKVTFDPNPVVVTGPAPEIDRIIDDPSLFRLEEIDFEKVRMDSSLQLGPCRALRVKKVSLKTRDNLVSVNLHIQEKEIAKTLKLIPVILFDNGRPLEGGVKEKASPNSETVDVEVRGRPSDFINVTDEDLRKRIMAVIDLKGQRVSNTYDVALWTSELSEGIRAVLKGDTKMVVRFESGETAAPAAGNAGK